MPQEFQILRCFSCETFQVDIVKIKTVKWQCKMCGAKQSIKYTYGKSSSSKDCRVQTQYLNSKRGNISDLECDTFFAQQPEKSNDSCYNSSGNKGTKVVEENYSYNTKLHTDNHDMFWKKQQPKGMTSHETTTSQTNNIANNTFEHLKPSKELKETEHVSSKWAKYLIEDYDKSD